MKMGLMCRVKVRVSIVFIVFGVKVMMILENLICVVSVIMLMKMVEIVIVIVNEFSVVLMWLVSVFRCICVKWLLIRVLILISVMLCI